MLLEEPSIFLNSGRTDGSDSRLTQRLQLLHRLLPHRLNVDACKAPLRGHFDQVRPLVTVWEDVAVKLRVVKQVLAVCKVPGPGGGKTVRLFFIRPTDCCFSPLSLNQRLQLTIISTFTYSNSTPS